MVEWLVDTTPLHGLRRTIEKTNQRSNDTLGSSSVDETVDQMQWLGPKVQLRTV